MVPEHRTWALIGSMSFSPQLCALCGEPQPVDSQSTAEVAEDAERAGSLNHTPRPHDETWNDARWRQNTGPGPSSAPCPSPPQLCALCGRETACIENAEACLLAVFAACNSALKAVGYLRPDRCQAVR